MENSLTTFSVGQDAFNAITTPCLLQPGVLGMLKPSFACYEDDVAAQLSNITDEMLWEALLEYVEQFSEGSPSLRITTRRVTDPEATGVMCGIKEEGYSPLYTYVLQRLPLTWYADPRDAIHCAANWVASSVQALQGDSDAIKAMADMMRLTDTSLKNLQTVFKHYFPGQLVPAHKVVIASHFQRVFAPSQAVKWTLSALRTYVVNVAAEATHYADKWTNKFVVDELTGLYNKPRSNGMTLEGNTEKELKALGCCIWADAEAPKWLVPLWMKPFLPHDLQVTSIQGVPCQLKDADTDARYGCIAFYVTDLVAK